MNIFRNLGFTKHNDALQTNASFLSVVLHE